MNFKVGDVVIYIASVTGQQIGKEAVVTSIGWRFREHDTGRLRADGVETTLSAPGLGGSCVRPEWLRIKRPPDEPKTDFTPAEDDFSEWLKGVRKVGA